MEMDDYESEIMKMNDNDFIKHLREKYKINDDDFFRIECALDNLYCPICQSCGIDGCCSPQRCLYLNSYQGYYDNLVKENEKLYDKLKMILNQLDEKINDFDELDEKLILRMLNSYKNK